MPDFNVLSAAYTSYGTESEPKPKHTKLWSDRTEYDRTGTKTNTEIKGSLSLSLFLSLFKFAEGNLFELYTVANCASKYAFCAMSVQITGC